jgi:hypothetical protein
MSWLRMFGYEVHLSFHVVGWNFGHKAHLRFLEEVDDNKMNFLSPNNVNSNESSEKLQREIALTKTGVLKEVPTFTTKFS